MYAHEHVSHERQPLAYNKHHHNTPTTGLLFLLLHGCPYVHGSSWCWYILIFSSYKDTSQIGYGPP